MSLVTKDKVVEQLRRVKGPDMEGNLVDLGLLSEVLLKDGRVYFSITVAAERATELEPLRQAAEKVVKEIAGVKGVTAVLTAEKPRAGATGHAPRSGPAAPGATPESPRVQAARARGGAGDGAHDHHHGHNHSHDHGHDHSHAVPAGPGGGRPAGAVGGAPARQAAGVPGIKHLVAVASGKGGVGKSTVAVNLALGFQAIGLKAGILDADIYGPSQPRLLGISGRPGIGANNVLQPMEGYGLKAMSMGFMVDEGTPVIWRGPMVVSALTQMLRDVAWGELDVLVIDMPPGTGDVQLTIAQQVPLSGAIIVSTPQDLALIDARKGLNMFRKTDIAILGIVENMSYFLCPKCGERAEVFGHGGAHQEADKLGVPFLGEIPLHIDVRRQSDAGQPIVVAMPDSLHAQIFRDLAAKSWSGIEEAQGRRVAPPKLEIAAAKDALEVTFEGATPFALPAEMLRVMSPSAEVQGHSPDQRVTVAGKRNVKISALRPIGNYAVKIVFDDGHDTGLYAWSYLALLNREKDKRWAQYLAEVEAKGMKRER